VIWAINDVVSSPPAFDERLIASNGFHNAPLRIALIPKNLHLCSRANVVFHREKYGLNDGYDKKSEMQIFSGRQLT
jgi:hypothetical protein